MDDRWKRIDEKLDVIVEKIHTIDVTLVRNTSSLEEHIRRTELLEKAVDNLNDEIRPIQSHVKTINLFVKILMLSLGAAASVASVLKLFYR